MKEIENVIDRLEVLIPHRSIENKSISKVSIGWQIDHSLRVIIGVCKALQASNPNEYTWSFNARRSLILLINWFPRGKAKAPRTTRPTSESTKDTLKSLILKARSEIKLIEGLSPNAHFEHPYFDQLNLGKAKKFLVIHTEHHLSIIQDILK